jgi:LAO/AO transport system kinase
MVRVFDAYGCDVVLVETVGVGQDELEITRTAHTTLVVVAPGLGDEIQAIKAGLMETADVFCVNKADRDGADATVRDLELMIALGSETLVAAGKSKGHVVHGETGGNPVAPGKGWTPPILRAVATRNEGLPELLAALHRHQAYALGSEDGRARRRHRLGEEVRESLREALIDEAMFALRAQVDEAVERVAARTLDPYSAIAELVQAFRSAQK